MNEGKIVYGYGKMEMDLPGNMKNGYFLPPTIMTEVDQNDKLMILVAIFKHYSPKFYHQGHYKNW